MSQRTRTPAISSPRPKITLAKIRILKTSFALRSTPSSLQPLSSVAVSVLALSSVAPSRFPPSDSRAILLRIGHRGNYLRTIRPSRTLKQCRLRITPPPETEVSTAHPSWPQPPPHTRSPAVDPPTRRNRTSAQFLETKQKILGILHQLDLTVSSFNVSSQLKNKCPHDRVGHYAEASTELQNPSSDGGYQSH